MMPISLHSSPRHKFLTAGFWITGILICAANVQAADPWKPYSAPAVERKNVFAFTKKPTVKPLSGDRYEISFAVKDYCDVTVGVIDPKTGTVVRHLGSGVLGSNAPAPFQKNNLQQKIYWDGKDDLDKYHKHPGSLQIRVSLGLKPEFDKQLGNTHPKNLPGYAQGLAADADGIYVFAKGMGRGHITVRKFDHDANYVSTVWPPPGNLSPKQLAGMGYVEYEPGKRAVQAPNIRKGTWREAQWLPFGIESKFGLLAFRPVASNGRLYFANSGFSPHKGFTVSGKGLRSQMHWIHTDGSTDYEGLRGRDWHHVDKTGSKFTAVTASPDGKTLYAVGFGRKVEEALPMILTGKVGESDVAKILFGHSSRRGKKDDQLSVPSDITCDAAGRIYVTDLRNNRVQIVSPDGKLLKSLSIDRPYLVQVHQKTGMVYVVHQKAVGGKSTPRVSRISPFPNLKLQQEFDVGPVDVMVLDSWSKKPRLWVSSQSFDRHSYTMEERLLDAGSLRVLQDDGKKMVGITNFDTEARKAAGKTYTGRWDGGMYGDLYCDPVRGEAYYKKKHIFNLKTGRFSRWFAERKPVDPTTSLFHSKHTSHMRGGLLDELAFCKRGFMHGHMAGGFPGKKAVVRMDPETIAKGQNGKSSGYAEVPYDYGEHKVAGHENIWKGVISGHVTAEQLYSFGMGVNMRGDVAYNMWLQYVPKMEDQAFGQLATDLKARQASGFWFGPNLKEAVWKKSLQESEKRGEKLFYVKHRPGIPLTGQVIFTFDYTGELRKEAAVVLGMRGNGVQIDEDGFLYTVNARWRMVGDKPFLFEKSGNFGGKPFSKLNKTEFTGTYIKCRGEGTAVYTQKAKVPMEPWPNRPKDLATPAQGSGGLYAGADVWVKNAEWMYAGASPIIAEHCDCPQMRSWLDWYKRSFVPEGHRHSIGVLDTNGNVILHIGRYGNFDSGYGPKSKVPLDGDGIATTMVRYVSGTDNYLVIADWGYRLIVVKLNYHVEETLPIVMKK